MPQFVIDANLPYKVGCWSNKDVVHVVKLNAAWSDDEIWSYAKENLLTIVTKDKDFLVKQIIEGSPPKVIHIKFGNLKLNEFINRIEAVWPEVAMMIQHHSVINIFLNKIEAIK